MKFKDSLMLRMINIALFGFSFFLLVSTIMHFVRPDPEPLKITLSMYVAGRFGWLLTLSFLTLSAGIFLLTEGIKHVLELTRMSDLGLLMLRIIASGVLVVAVFPVEETGVPWTSDVMHHLGAYLVFYAFPFASLVLALEFRKEENWRPVYPAGLGISLVYTLILVANLVGPLTDFLNTYVGAAQKLLILLILAFLYLAGFRLKRLLKSPIHLHST